MIHLVWIMPTHQFTMSRYYINSLETPSGCHCILWQRVPLLMTLMAWHQPLCTRLSSSHVGLFLSGEHTRDFLFLWKPQTLKAFCIKEINEKAIACKTTSLKTRLDAASLRIFFKAPTFWDRAINCSHFSPPFYSNIYVKRNAILAGFYTRRALLLLTRCLAHWHLIHQQRQQRSVLNDDCKDNWKATFIGNSSFCPIVAIDLSWIL